MNIGLHVNKENLRHLPTSARPVVDAPEISVPTGYKVEAVVAGLSFPTGMTFADDGTLFVNEGGSTWPTRPAMPPRLLRLDTSGNLDVFAVETLGGPRGITYHEGHLYLTVKGGYHTSVIRYNCQTKERLIIHIKIPNGGWHEPGGPIIGPHDGLLYFAQGSVSQNGVVLPQGFTVDLAKYPETRDVTGEDVILTGNNVTSRNLLMPYPYLTETGPFIRFGDKAEKGEVVKNELCCNTAVWRANPDGSNPELLAWGIRKPYGMAFSEAGELYVSDNDFEEKRERAIAGDPNRIWHVKNAKKAQGTIEKPEWYGFPDIAADGFPVWDEKYLPKKGKPAEPLIENLKRILVVWSSSVILLLGISVILYGLQFPLLGPDISSDFSISTLGWVYVFSLFYSWIWVDGGAILLKKLGKLFPRVHIEKKAALKKG